MTVTNLHHSIQIEKRTLKCVFEAMVVMAIMAAGANSAHGQGTYTQGSRPAGGTQVDQASYSTTSRNVARPGSSHSPIVAEPKTGRRITPAGESSSQSTKQPTSPFGTFIALLVVVAIIGFAYRVMKKGGAGLRTGLPTAAVEVLGNSVLGHRQAIQIVRIGSRILVLGSSADGLTTLSEITDAEEVAALAGACKSEKSAHSMKSVVDIFAPRKPAGRKVQREPIGRSGMEDLHA